MERGETKTGIIEMTGKSAEQLGYSIAKGAIRYLVKFAFAVWIVVLLIVAINNAAGVGTDDCDLDAWHRCGVKVITDHKTGVQYLMAPNGGLVRRANGSGASQ
jgi:hypothetical protein